MKDLREEVGTKACIVGKIVKSRMKCAGHMVRMKDDELPKRVEAKKQECSRKRGRPQRRWEDCVKRELIKAEEEENGEKRPTTGTNGSKLRKQPYFAVTSRSASPLHKGNHMKNNHART